MALKIQVRQSTVVTLAGRLDTATSPRAEAGPGPGPRPRRQARPCRPEFISSAGLRVPGARKTLTDAGPVRAHQQSPRSACPTLLGPAGMGFPEREGGRRLPGLQERVLEGSSAELTSDLIVGMITAVTARQTRQREFSRWSAPPWIPGLRTGCTASAAAPPAHGLGTVYRNLKRLAEGHDREIHTGGHPARFDGNTGRHYTSVAWAAAASTTCPCRWTSLRRRPAGP